MAIEKSKCLGKEKCKLFNAAGYLMCRACGYQEDEDYEYGE
jgi:hypothetical protein